MLRLWLRYSQDYVDAPLRLRWATSVHSSPAAPERSCYQTLSDCWSAERLDLMDLCCLLSVVPPNFRKPSGEWIIRPPQPYGVCVCVWVGCVCVCLCLCAYVVTNGENTWWGTIRVINAVKTLMGWTLNPFGRPVLIHNVFSLWSLMLLMTTNK